MNSALHTSPGTMVQPDRDTPVPRWLQPLLLIVAGIESWAALSSVPVLFGDLSDVPGPGLGGWTITVSLALRPLFAIAAFVFAVRRQPRRAIMALAAVIVVNWFSMLPSFVRHGLDFEGFAVVSAMSFLLFPVLAAASLAISSNYQRLAAAAVLVSIPTVVDVLGTAAFALSVLVYGF